MGRERRGCHVGRAGPPERSLMLGNLAKKVFGSSNDRRLKTYRPKVAAINALEPELIELSDEELAHRTVTFREAARRRHDRSTICIVPAFATVREAAKRVLGQRHFDVQLIGGMVLERARHRRDAHRRGQDAGGDARRLPQRARGEGRPRRHGERLPRPPRRRMDGPGVSLSRAHHRHYRARSRRRGTGRRATGPTSPTAPTTSSASTTCATT